MRQFCASCLIERRARRGLSVFSAPYDERVSELGKTATFCIWRSDVSADNGPIEWCTPIPEADAHALVKHKPTCRMALRCYLRRCDLGNS